MEDPSLVWKIQEYSPFGGSSQVSWILNKGLRLGKKVVITGIVISSAPLVIPPLVVFSALGLAFSVPFGFFFASYACTEKLMSKLLSRPTPPPFMLEYGTVVSTDEEEIGGNGEEDMGFGGGTDLEEEEEEQIEDTKEGVEMRIELLDRGNEGLEESCGVEKVSDIEEEEKLVRETRGLMERIRDEQQAKDMRGRAGERDEENVRNVEEMEKPFGDETNQKGIDAKLDKLSREMETTVGKRRDEDIVDNVPREVKPVEEMEGKSEGNVDLKKPFGDTSEMINVGSIIREEQKPVVDKRAMLQGGRDENNIARERENVIRSNADAREIADESGFDLFDDQNAAENERGAEISGRQEGYVGSIIREEQKPVVDKRAMLQGGRDDNNIARERENAIRSNADAREIADESGFDLFDDQNAAENEQSSRYIGEGGADFVECPVSAGVPESRQAGISSEIDITMPSDENVAEEGNYGGGLDLEEEEELMDTKDGVEIRIELVDKRNEELKEGNLSPGGDHGRGGVNKDEQKPIKYEKERGYEEDFGDFLLKEEEHPLVETDVIIEGMREEENVINIEEESRDQQPIEEWGGIVVEIGGHEKNASNVEEVEEPFGVTSGVGEKRGGEERVIDIEEGIQVRETRGVIEESRDGGNVKNTVEEDEQHLKEMCGVAEKKNIRNVKEMEKPSEDKYIDYNVKLEKPVGETKTAVKESRDEDNVDTVSKEMKPVKEMGGLLEGNTDKTSDDYGLEGEKLMGDTNGMINVGSMIEEEHKPTVDKKDMVHGGIAEDYVAHEDRQMARETKNTISSDADAREIADESGFDLFDEIYENPEGEVLETGAQYYYPPFSNLLGHKVDIGLTHASVQNEQSSDNIDSNSSDFVELPVSANLPESKHVRIASEKEIIMPSNKALCSEEKIWEQIDALRTIVGYKAVSHATCVEEVKALYIFTGVEPPVSFRDPSDLLEVYNKLRFLMSIVGVK